MNWKAADASLAALCRAPACCLVEAPPDASDPQSEEALLLQSSSSDTQPERLLSSSGASSSQRSTCAALSASPGRAPADVAALSGIGGVSLPALDRPDKSAAWLLCSRALCSSRRGTAVLARPRRGVAAGGRPPEGAANGRPELGAEEGRCEAASRLLCSGESRRPLGR